MHKIVEADLGLDILGANREEARKIGDLLLASGVAAYELMGSIGSGKTLLIERMVEHLAGKGIRTGAIAGDVAGEDDYRRLKRYGIEAANVNTGKECHLDAHLIGHALRGMDLSAIDVLFIENVGNLVCPADFPLGAKKRVVVVSVTEGDDMARKHPVMFGTADLVVINKTDLADAVGVDPGTIEDDIAAINRATPVIRTDAMHGVGVISLVEALEFSAR